MHDECAIDIFLRQKQQLERASEMGIEKKRERERVGGKRELRRNREKDYHALAKKRGRGVELKEKLLGRF